MHANNNNNNVHFDTVSFLQITYQDVKNRLEERKTDGLTD